MGDISTTRTEEGTEIQLKRLYRGWDKPMNLCKFFKPIALFFVIMGLIFLIKQHSIGGFLGMFPFIFAFYFLLCYKKELANPAVDTIDHRIRDIDGNWQDYDGDSELILDRTIIRKNMAHSTAKSTDPDDIYFIVNWSVILSTGDKKSVISEFRQQEKGLSHLLTYMGADWVKLAEQLAELSSLPLVDTTGMEPVRRESKELDVNLKEYLLKHEKLSLFGGDISAAIDKEFEISEEQGKYVIKDRDRNISQGNFSAIVITLLLTSFFLFVAIQASRTQPLFLTIFLGFFAAFFGFGLFVFSNSLRTQNILTISSDLITYRQRGLFVNVLFTRIDTTEVEKIIKFKIEDKTKNNDIFGLELVSDEKRIGLVGDFDKNEIDILEELIEQLIISV